MARAKPGREHWADAWGAKSCSLCSAQFGVLTWKHHCRACGGVFCGKCTDHRIKYTPHTRRHDEGYTEKEKKVCSPCFVRISGERARAAEAQIKEADLFKKEVHNQLSAMVVIGDVCNDFRTVKPRAPECLFFNLSDEGGMKLLQDRRVVLFDVQLPKAPQAASVDVEYAPEEPAAVGADGLAMQCQLPANQIYCDYDERNAMLEVRSDSSEATWVRSDSSETTWESIADVPGGEASEKRVEMEASLLDMQFKLANQIWICDMQRVALGAQQPGPAGARHDECSEDVLEQKESSILDLQFDIAIRKMKLRDHNFPYFDHMYLRCEA